MKRTSAELKQIARYNLQGHYGIVIGTTIVSGLIITVALIPFSLILDIYNSISDYIIYQLASIIISLVSTVFSAGLIHIHFKLARKETPVFTDLFFGFTRRPDRFILAGLISLLAGFVCAAPGTVCIVLFLLNGSLPMLAFGLVLFLAGVIAAFLWALAAGLTIPLLTEHDDLDVIRAFRESFRLMSGNKARMFYISLSFLGWALLAVCSCYIGMLWLIPYMNQTTVAFYRDVTGELDSWSDTPQ